MSKKGVQTKKSVGKNLTKRQLGGNDIPSSEKTAHGKRRVQFRLVFRKVISQMKGDSRRLKRLLFARPGSLGSVPPLPFASLPIS